MVGTSNEFLKRPLIAPAPPAGRLPASQQPFHPWPSTVGSCLPDTRATRDPQGIWRYLKMVGFCRENPNRKWMMTRGTLMYGNPRMGLHPATSDQKNGVEWVEWWILPWNMVAWMLFDNPEMSICIANYSQNNINCLSCGSPILEGWDYLYWGWVAYTANICKYISVA